MQETTQISRRLRKNYSEALFKNQLALIDSRKNLKKEFLKKYVMSKKEEDEEENKPRLINFNDSNKSEISFEWSYFDYDLIFTEETPLIKTPWVDSSIKPNNIGIETRGIIFRSKELLNFAMNGAEFSISFYLKGESTCWIFSRVNDFFDDSSVIMKIEKEENCQRIFASLGTFIKDIRGNLIFRVFLRQQLIDFSEKTKNSSYVENDISFVKMYMLDSGYSKILSKIFVNDSVKDNFICSDFNLPCQERKRVMIAGSGEQCLVKHFIARSVYLDETHLQSIENNIIPTNLGTSKKQNPTNGKDNCVIM
jgi:hypothetical protein